MRIANSLEARSHLIRPVRRATRGDEVIIARAGEAMVRLVPVRPDEAPRRGGRWKRKVRVAPDFDVLPDDLARAFGMETESRGPGALSHTPTAAEGDRVRACGPVS
jgi:antitoxin (DNA-binding transcriptional repressor) of toxin-antitoxin stability system